MGEMEKKISKTFPFRQFLPISHLWFHSKIIYKLLTTITHTKNIFFKTQSQNGDFISKYFQNFLTQKFWKFFFFQNFQTFFITHLVFINSYGQETLFSPFFPLFFIVTTFLPFFLYFITIHIQKIKNFRIFEFFSPKVKLDIYFCPNPKKF